MSNTDFQNGIILGASAGSIIPEMNIDSEVSSTSKNPVQNKVIKAYVDNAIAAALIVDTEEVIP